MQVRKTLCAITQTTFSSQSRGRNMSSLRVLDCLASGIGDVFSLQLTSVFRLFCFELAVLHCLMHCHVEVELKVVS